MLIFRLLLTSLLVMTCLYGFAAESLDYGLKAKKIADNTYVFIGKKEDFSLENGGNIVNTGFIVGNEGVVIIDTGPSLKYGEQMYAAIQKVTDKKIIKILLTHHHPDHILGNQAFAGIPVYTLATIKKLIQRDGDAFIDNVYRMVGDWMKGTVVVNDIQTLDVSSEDIGGHTLRYLAMSGHTDADLMVLDESTGVLFAGDVVFHNRALTTPHATPEEWKKTLNFLLTTDYKILVPGHGEIATSKIPVKQTLDYLTWLEETIAESVNRGLEMNEVLSLPIPKRFSHFGVLKNEFTRSVTHRYRIHEDKLLSTVN